MAAFVIAIVGAESTGKSTLSTGLADQLPALTSLRCQSVPEALRAWCDAHGRTPAPHEQANIAQTQADWIEQASQSADIVVCDTTPLMTAIYSQLLFDDHSLLAQGQQFHAGCDLTLLTGLDLPWVADGLQRDGPHVRQPVDAAIRRALLQANLSWSSVFGQGQARIESALNAITSAWQRRSTDADTRASSASGLFTRLQQRESAMPGWRWICNDCDVPECEHASLVANLQAAPIKK